MILYNASISNGLRNYTRFLTNTNTTTYSNADLDASLNMWYHTVVNEILQSMDDWDFQGEIGTGNLVAGQQEYTLPTDILKIKKVQVTFDGTNWKDCTPMDIASRTSGLDSTSISYDFSTSEPFFDLMDGSLFLYPIPSASVTGGLKIWYEKEAIELSAVTDEPSFLEAYHKILCYGSAKDYFEKYSEKEGNTNKRNLMQQNFNDYMDRMKEFYGTRNQERDYVINTSYTEYDYDLNN